MTLVYVNIKINSEKCVSAVKLYLFLYWERAVPAGERVPAQGVPVWGGVGACPHPLLGGACPEGVPAQGGACSGGLPRGVPAQGGTM